LEYLVAQVGRTIGLYGDLKLNLHTDFPEQFKVGVSYKSNRGELTISAIDLKRGIVRFVGYEGIDSAKRLTNTKLYADEDKTKEHCDLKEGEHFWFDVIGCQVMQDGDVLGVVKEIQRMANTDYIFIETDDIWVEKGFSKTFLLPYIKEYIEKTDPENKIVYAINAKDILEAS